MDTQYAQLVLAEKRRRDAAVAQVKAIIDIDHELSLHPYDRVRVDYLQAIIAEKLGLEVADYRVRNRINTWLLALGLTRAKFHGRVHYRGIRRRP